MLRNRLPVYADIALKWCRVKEFWLNHVYNSQINLFSDKQDRYNATRIVLGLSSKERVFKFEDSVDWSWITEEDLNQLLVGSISLNTIFHLLKMLGKLISH